MNTTTSFLPNQSVSEASIALIQKLLPVKTVEYHIFESLPKTCPHADRIQMQREDMGGVLIFDILASLLGQTAVTQSHFPYTSKEDIKKIYHTLWPSSFSDHESTVVGHLLTIYLLLNLPDNNPTFQRYCQTHKIPFSLQSLVKAYRSFDIGLYDEFLSNLTSFVSFQLSSIQETSRLDSGSCNAILMQLLKHREYKAAFFFVESFGLKCESSVMLKMLFYYDFRSCLHYVRSHVECLPSFLELCVLPEHDKLTRQLLEIAYTKDEIVLMSQYGFKQLHNARLANFVFLLFYVNHHYALAIFFHSFLGADSYLEKRKKIVDTMLSKLTHEERQALQQYQLDGSFPLALRSLSTVSLEDSLVHSQTSSLISEHSSPSIPPASSTHTRPPLVFRSKPPIVAPPSKWQRVEPEPPVVRDEKVRSMQHRLHQSRSRRKKKIQTDPAPMEEDIQPSEEVPMESDDDMEGSVTPLASSRYSLRMRKVKEESDV